MSSPPAVAARQVIDALSLDENPHGGWFRQIQRVPDPSDASDPSDSTGASRPVLTVINYLLEAGAPIAALHRMSADAMHLFHQGSPLAILTISPEGELQEALLGADVDAGHVLQHLVPGGWWKAFEVRGPWSLISEAVAPGWDAADEEVATPALYERDHPELRSRIERFVR